MARKATGGARQPLRRKSVLATLAGFFFGAERGQYTQLHDRDDLWHLLVKITIRKAQRLVKEQQRLKRRETITPITPRLKP